MIIREAENKDIPEIVKVLKASLGTVDLPLSEEIWNYKHQLNPFGESLVLVAEENNRIAGVRAFMRWNWQKGDKLFKCVRAVDTATHPDFQGKGIFKKLTLAAVEKAKEEGCHLVFNTPNEKSRPGYLKMGWEKAGKLRVALKPDFSLQWLMKSSGCDLETSKDLSSVEIEEICDNRNKHFQQTNLFFTPKSSEFLSWRYETNPLQKYQVIAKDNFYLACYLKKRDKLSELRISESLYDQAKKTSSLSDEIRIQKKRNPALFNSYAPEHWKESLSFTGAYGPVLTIRDLNLSKSEYPESLKVSNWAYSLGDLELF